MSGLPWIQVASDMPTHRKSILLGIHLQDKRAWTHVVQLWMWAACHQGDGVMAGVGADDFIEHAAGWLGPRGAFVQACVRVGFLDEISNGYAIHDWQDYAGAHIDRRERDAKRKRKSRSGHADVTRTSGGRRTESSGRRAESASETETETETETERETEKEKVSEPASHPEQNPDAWLAGLGQKLGDALQKPALKVGKRRDAVIREFSRWTRIVGVDATVAECVRLAAEKGESPSYLSWWPGWLATTTDSELRRAAIRPVEAM